MNKNTGKNISESLKGIPGNHLVILTLIIFMQCFVLYFKVPRSVIFCALNNLNLSKAFVDEY